MTTIALYSNKGGVGKTAAAVNLSYLAAQQGHYTLICDLDPQSSTTYYFRVKPKLRSRARGLTRPGKPIDKSIKGTDFENLDLLPADFTHRNLDITFDRLTKPKERLRQILDPLKSEYDLIILDSPPTINILAENIFNAADFVLVPIIPTTLSVRTYRQFLSFFRKNGYDAGSVYGFLSMVDRRKKMHHQLSSLVKEEFGHIFQNPIPYQSVVEQMGIQRQPVVAFAPRSRAANAYRLLWAELADTILIRSSRARPSTRW
jgi:chromosome partitioning protein